MVFRTIFIAAITVLICKETNSWNIDTNFPTVYHGEAGSYFGFTVGLHNTGHDNTVLVGAPKGNDPNLMGVISPGCLMKCSIQDQSCTHVVLETTGNNHTSSYTTDRKTITIMDLKNNNLLGFSMDVSTNHIAVCAPGWRNMFLSTLYPVNGACYVIDKELTQASVKKLTPLADRAKQSKIPLYTHYYAYGQAGFSVKFHKSDNKLVLGAPGLADWTGNLITLPQNDLAVNPVIANLPKELDNGGALYIGYSIASGQYFGTTSRCIAAGAPRDGDLTGRVYIMKYWTVKDKTTMNVSQYLEGQQFGEYFGASVLGVDLNGDQITDLIVGSPLHTTSAKGGDNGRIYQYLGTPNGLRLTCTTTGSGVKGARFGSALTDLGDLNLDGYDDFAVGAPYEDGKGAVYIYHGSKNGLTCDYVQKITASQVGVAGPGFGISLSNGFDIDNNQYPDLVVGSYGDDTAVLLKSRPIIYFDASLTTVVRNIDLKSPNCVPRSNSSSDPCLVVTFCLKYSGKHVPLRTVASVNVSVDGAFQSVTLYPRGFFGVEGKINPVLKIQTQMELDANIATCKDMNVYILLEKGVNYEDPLKFEAKYGLINNKQGQFCKTCPVTSKQELGFVELKVPFAVGCGSDNICQSDMSLSAKVLQMDSKPELVIGVDTQVNLQIVVGNKGEAAYAPTVEVIVPNALALVNPGICAPKPSSAQFEEYRLECSLSNPLKTNAIVKIHIKLDASKLKHDGIQIVQVEASTVSHEQATDNNHQTIAIPFKSKFGLQLVGIPYPASQIYNQETENQVPFQHSYEIFSKYTPVDEILLEIALPSYGGDPPDIVNITNLEVVGPVICDNLWEKPEEENVIIPSRLRAEKRKTNEKEYTLNCETTECKKISCFGGPIDPENTVKVIVSGIADISLVKTRTENPLIDLVFFLTNGRVLQKNGGAYIEPPIAQAQVKTTMTKAGFDDMESISLWIIIGSVLGGVILLIIIIIVLVKCGFFRRKTQEDLEELKKEDKLLDESGRPSTM